MGQKDPPEKVDAIHSSILAFEIPWTEKPRVLQSMGSGKEQKKKERREGVGEDGDRG